jgi:hypothetical protein
MKSEAPGFRGRAFDGFGSDPGTGTIADGPAWLGDTAVCPFLDVAQQHDSILDRFNPFSLLPSPSTERFSPVLLTTDGFVSSSVDGPV